MTNKDECYFEYYVLNESRNTKKIEPYNVFNNSYVNSTANKEVRKYLRNPKKYSYKGWGDESEVFGFEAFAKKIGRTIAGEEWGRCEYEVIVGSMFDRDGKSYRKIDCYQQCEPNINMIARECIYQYKKWKKGLKNGQSGE